jgi:hypothetical protein
MKKVKNSSDIVSKTFSSKNQQVREPLREIVKEENVLVSVANTQSVKNLTHCAVTSNLRFFMKQRNDYQFFNIKRQKITA